MTPGNVRHEQEVVDLSTMLNIHDAFRRDLARLPRAVRALPSGDGVRPVALIEHWEFVADQLRHHHESEDDQLWPLVRRHLSGHGPDSVMLECMEADHDQLNPLIDAVTAAMSNLGPASGPAGSPAAAAALDRLGADVGAHLDREEKQALPLIAATLSGDEYAEFVTAQQRALGEHGAAASFPWILEGADEARVAATLNRLPAPMRLSCRRAWQPWYASRCAQLWSC